MEKTQAPAALVALASTLAAKARNDLDRPLKPQNPNLYYGHSSMKCYYFYQESENYFKIARSLDHKFIFLATDFLKDRILYQQ